MQKNNSTAMMARQLISLNIGTPSPLQRGDETVSSGIFKTPVAGPVVLSTLGLKGDVQVDRKHHGGPDKAVNVYPHEHYAYWSEQLGVELSPGAFGENFTTTGLLETEVCIGDVYRVGEALVQVTQPRQPCWKLAAKHSEPQLIRWVEKSGKTGFYVRCLEEGSVSPGDLINLEDRLHEGITITESYAIHRSAGKDPAGVRRLLAIESLSEAWREDLERHRK